MPDIGPWTPGSTSYATHSLHMSPEPLQTAQGAGRYPAFLQPLHQRMPLSPRNSRHANQQHPQSQPQSKPSRGPDSLPGASLARCSSTKPHNLSPQVGRVSPVPSKGAPVSLPDIQQQQHHHHHHTQYHPQPHAGASLQGLHENRGSHRPSEELGGLGSRLHLEPKGSLAHCVSEHEGILAGEAQLSKEASIGTDQRGSPSPIFLNSQPVEPSKGEPPVLVHVSELEARRKALAMVAFVRHSTADLQAAAKLAAAHTTAAPRAAPPPPASPSTVPTLPSAMPSSPGGTEHQPVAPKSNHQDPQGSKAEPTWQPPSSRGVFSPQLETWCHSKDLPGSLYGHSPELQGIDGFCSADSQWPPQLPTTSEGAFELLASPHRHLPQIVLPSAPAQPVSNLNGFGHPVVSRDAKAAKALVDSYQVEEAVRNRSLVHVPPELDQKRKKGKGLHQSLHSISLFNAPEGNGDGWEGCMPKQLSPFEIRKLVAMETTNKRSSRVLMSKETLPSSRPSQAAPQNPAYVSHLELWGGKRLNGVERKVDKQLHQLHMNMSAKAELLDRVNAYVLDREAKAAEHAALTMFANERREQRTITFMQRQAKYGSPKAAAVPVAARQPQHQAASPRQKKHALFHPVTGEPVDDGIHLPQSSSCYWTGFVVIMQHVQKLGAHVANERRKRMEVLHQAALKIQAAWRGYRCREPLMQMYRMATEVPRDDSSKQPPTAQVAADLIMDFLAARHDLGRKEAAAAAMQATAARARAGKSRAEMLRGIHTALMLRQWERVEASAIEVSQKRTRGNAALGVADKGPPQRPERSMMQDFLSARKKGDMPNLAYSEEQKEMAIRKATQAAVNRTFATDRIIHENWKPVPEAVKAAVLTVYQKLKTEAYIKLVGLVWQARARYKALKRERSHLDAAKDVLERKQHSIEGTPGRGQSPAPGEEQSSRSQSRSPEQGAAWDLGLDAHPGGDAHRSRSSSPHKEYGAESRSSSRGSLRSSPAEPPQDPSAQGNAAQQPLPSALVPAGAHGAAARGQSVTISGIFDSAGQAKEAEPLQGTEGDQGAEEKGSKEEGVGEAKGVHDFKFHQLARKKYFELQKSRRSSVGYQARGRTRVLRSLDAQALLEEGKGPPTLPLPHNYMTLMEMKALMQQGVMETALYNGFMLKGSIPAHERNFNHRIAKTFDATDSKTKRQMYRVQSRIHGKSKRGTIHLLHKRESLADGFDMQPGSQAASSWTMALLTARWHAECFPRTQACLLKRLNLLRVDLLDCLMHGKALQPGEMGQHLQHLVLNP